MIKFSSAFAPRLKKMCFNLYSTSPLHDIFGELGKSSHVKSIVVQSAQDTETYGSAYHGERVERSVKHHAHLKEVEFWGFTGMEDESVLTLYILKSAVALQQMCINNCRKFYRGCDRWEFNKGNSWEWEEEKRKMIPQRLLGEAVSERA